MENFGVDFLAGWAGGCHLQTWSGISGILIGHPMDTIKVRQQILGQSSAWKCFTETVKHEGVRGLLKGMASPLLCSGVLNSIYFGVYGNTLRLLDRNQKAEVLSPYVNVYLAGCSAGLAQLFVACPVDLVKIKLQTQTGNHGASNKTWDSSQKPKLRGPLDCLGSIYKTEGLRGCYRGFSIMFFRDVPTFGLYVVIYEKIIREGPSWGLPNGVALFCLAGGTAGVMTWASIIPLDVVKSRLQADNPVKPVYKGTWHCFVTSYKSEGWSVFTRGFSMVILRAFPVNAATFLAYQLCLDTFKLTVRSTNVS